jgi:hypothetical protein
VWQVDIRVSEETPGSIFVKLGEELEEIECAVDAEYSIQKPENLILEQWNSLPQTFSAMKKLSTALLTLFGSSYACEQLFSEMNFVKSTVRNRPRLTFNGLHVVISQKIELVKNFPWPHLNFRNMFCGRII